MTYNRPTDLSFTDLCIWIDKNSNDENCDEAKLYEYLYHIVVILAQKHKYFNRMHYYDEFGIYSASKLYMRIKPSDKSSKELPQIKSILNYVKAVIYPYKVDFEQEYYLENPQESVVIHASSENISCNLCDDVDIFDLIDFRSSLGDIPRIIRAYLEKIPKRYNHAEWLHIYISCLLTLLNSICPDLTNYDKNLSSSDLHKVYLSSYNQKPILYHLDGSYSNYITVLVRELHQVIAKELSISTHENISMETSIKNLIINNQEEAE